MNLLNKKHIISYNLSWATQDNVVKGSESKFVKWCIDNSKNNSRNKTINFKNGMKRDKVKFPNWCTQSAINTLITHIKHIGTIEFILFQEPTSNLFIKNKHVLNYINSNIDNTNIAIDDVNSLDTKPPFLNICYNKRKFKLIKIKESYKLPPLNDGRRCLIVLFENIHTREQCVVANVHFPHRGKTGHSQKGLFDNIVSKMTTNIALNTRYIIGGDFNGEPEFKSKLFKKYTTLPKTCCHGGNHEGDIIYDTHQASSKSFVKIINYPFKAPTSDFKKTRENQQYIMDNDTYYGSDHLPVYLSDIYNLSNKPNVINANKMSLRPGIETKNTFATKKNKPNVINANKMSLRPGIETKNTFATKKNKPKIRPPTSQVFRPRREFNRSSSVAKITKPEMSTTIRNKDNNLDIPLTITLSLTMAWLFAIS